MEYTKVKLNSDVAVGKTFEFPTSEIQTIDYSKFYGEVCKGMNPVLSYGIYEIGEETTKFTVAIQTEYENQYKSFKVPEGDYIEFEIDMMENQKENQYTKCIEQLFADGYDVDMSYSFEIMDNSFDPTEGKFLYKYYLRVK